MRYSIKPLIVTVTILTIIVALMSPMFAVQAQPVLLNPLTIPKWVNQIAGAPPAYEPTVAVDPNTGKLTHYYTINITSFKQQILPAGTPLVGNPTRETWVWGYGGKIVGGTFLANSPAASFEAVRGIPIQVTWINNISTPQMFAVDPTLHWANPNKFPMPMEPVTAPPFPPGYPEAQYNVSLVTHLHGGEVRSDSDGYPEAWYTYNGIQGPEYGTTAATDPNAAVFYYPNDQQGTTLWYHDHALGVTRINVMSGLAGFYLLRDPADTVEPLLPSGNYEVPLVIQDRTFTNDGQLFFDNAGINPTIHPYWVPEFFGNTIMVNGKVWPFMNVDSGWYRLRFLDGSNARFYTLTFVEAITKTIIPFYQIGSDGGYLKAPAPLTSLTIAPGERADILIDFSNLAAGTNVLLRNKAKAPFPAGATADPRTVGQIMQFRVTGNAGFQQGVALPATLPVPLNPTLTGLFPNLPMPSRQRILTLAEVMGALGPLEVLLDGQKWHAPITENPINGATEEWMIVNPTADAHPIHLHLVQFQLVSRQKFNVAKYTTDWATANGVTWPLMEALMNPTQPTALPLTSYLQGNPKPAPLNEQGWKDTVQMNPEEVTIIRVRWAAQDGSAYTFDPTAGPGYVWHCHILEHEDNEMMRPYEVQPAP